MSKVQLKQIGPFNPVEIIEVEEEKVKDLMATKNYILLETTNDAEIKSVKSTYKKYGKPDTTEE
jgi:hypothetical protein